MTLSSKYVAIISCLFGLVAIWVIFYAIENEFYPPTPSEKLVSGMKMTFDDEFNTFNPYLDAKGNVTCTGNGTGTWQTVYYNCSRTNASNDEAEEYIDPNFISYFNTTSSPSAPTSAKDPFSVSNGVLSIEAAPSDPPLLDVLGPTAQYTSGIITTQYSFAQTYGYFEMRAELPAGKGLWPAFWLLPVDTSWPPEIDAVEAFGATTTSGEGGVTMIHYASHTPPNNQTCGNWYNTGVNVTAGFHTYGVDWEPNGITYYFDGKPYATCPANASANKPFYMLIDLAVGGSTSWPGSPDASNTWPAYLRIDYVRAYQTK
jgi:beta-glucanase (GH16 family)